MVASGERQSRREEEQQALRFDDLQRVSKVIERTQGHYEVQETPYGEAYVWCPGAWWSSATAARDLS